MAFFLISIYGAAQVTTPQSTTEKKEKGTEDRLKKIEDQLKKQDEVGDFALTVGIGTLSRNGNYTDYVNNTYVLSRSNSGGQTPQYLVGVSLRTALHRNPFQWNRRDNGNNAQPPTKIGTSPAVVETSTSENTTTETSTAGQSKIVITKTTTSKISAAPSNPIANDSIARTQSDSWSTRPWSGFVSVKFASDSSQVLNGFVIGGSFRAAHYLDVLIGYAVTPVNEPSPGLRNAAALYVEQQQKLGNLLRFDPAAMRKGAPDAFDGFSLKDPNGKLIYEGNPLNTHFRDGVVVGVAVPFSFSDALRGK
jgi:hypothetical protein